MKIHFGYSFFFIVICQDDDSSNEHQQHYRHHHPLQHHHLVATAPLARSVQAATATTGEQLDDSSSLDGNEIEDETISGENDVEYAEFSMAHRMPSSQGSTNNSVLNGVCGGDGNSDANAIDEELMLLSLFDDSNSSNSGHMSTHHLDGSSASGHSCESY